MSLAPAAEVTYAGAMFVSSRRLTLLDHFRVPYEVDPPPGRDLLGRLEPATGGPALLWPAEEDAEPVAAMVLGRDDEPSVRLFARVVPDHRAQRLLAAEGGWWERERLVIGPDGTQLASLWRRGDGTVFLPFDPDEVVANYWSERYSQIHGAGGGSRVRRGAMRSC